MSDTSSGTTTTTTKKSSSGSWLKSALIFLVVAIIVGVVIYFIVVGFTENDGSGGSSAPPECSGSTEVPGIANLIRSNSGCSNYLSRDENDTPFLRESDADPLLAANIWLFELDTDSGSSFYFVRSAYPQNSGLYLTQLNQESDQVVLGAKSQALSFFISNINGTFVLESNDRNRNLLIDSGTVVPYLPIDAGSTSFVMFEIPEEQRDQIDYSQDGGTIPVPPEEDLNYIWGIQKDGKVKRCEYPCSTGNWIDFPDDTGIEWERVGVYNGTGPRNAWFTDKDDNLYRCPLPCQSMGDAEKIGDQKIAKVNAKDPNYLWGIRPASDEKNSRSLVRCKQPCNNGDWEDIGASGNIQQAADVTAGIIQKSNIIVFIDFQSVDPDGNDKGKVLYCKKPCNDTGDAVQYLTSGIEFISATDALFGTENNSYAVKGRAPEGQGEQTTSGQMYALYSNRVSDPSEEINFFRPSGNNLFSRKILTVGKEGDFLVLSRGENFSDGGELFLWPLTSGNGITSNLSVPSNSAISDTPILFTDVSY